MTGENAALAETTDRSLQRSEEQQKKRAYDIVKRAVRNSMIPLNNREVGHRLLPGLWSATVYILLACLETADVIKLISNRMAGLPHSAENGDVLPISLTDAQFARYVAEVSAAGQIIAETIAESTQNLEKEGLDDRLPEAILDCTVFLLVNSWGPEHLRRAMIQQVSALLRGHAAPAVFLEPRETIKRKNESEHGDPEPVKEHSQGLPDRNEKIIRFFVDYVLLSDHARWAVAIMKTSPDQTEELHVIKGNIPDSNGRLAPLTAVVEALKSVLHENIKCSVTLETPHEFLLRGMEGHGDERLAFRYAGEEALWRDFDTLTQGRDMRYKAVTANLSDHLQNACDIAMKRGVIGLV